MSGLADVVKAADFAARKHKDQRRKAADQLPYINHPIGVAHILMSEGGIDDPIGNVQLLIDFIQFCSQDVVLKKEFLRCPNKFWTGI